MKTAVFSHIFFFLLCFFIISSKAQASEGFIFRTFSPEGGFYFDGVKAIQQDKSGFIWVLMGNDLYRFDGYRYIRYYSHFQEKNINVRWGFNNITKNKYNDLFVSTSRGLFGYNNHNGDFQLTTEKITQLLIIDSKDRFWHINAESDLAIFDQRKETSIVPEYKGNSISGIGSLFEVTEGMFISQLYENIFIYDYHSHGVNLFISLPDVHIRTICVQDEKMWVLSQDDGLFSVDRKTKEVKHYKLGNDHISNEYRALFIDENGMIWIGTLNGLYVFNPKDEAYKLYTNSEINPFSLPNNSIWTIQEDQHNNLWIGTYSGGLSYVNLSEKEHFRTYSTTTSDINHNLVTTFAENEKYIWLGTEGGGLNRITKKNGDVTVFKHVENRNSLSYNHVKNIVFDKNQNLWISMFRGGLDRMDRYGKFTHFNDKNGLYHNSLRKSVLEKNTGLWISYQVSTSVVTYYSFTNNTFKHIVFDENEKNNYIYDICRDSLSDFLWIITQHKLYKLDIATHKVYPIETGIPLNGMCILADTVGNIWIGTVGKGLIQYNINKNEFTVFDDILKFNISSIYSISQDNNGDIWLGTNNGLFKYDVKQNHFAGFGTIDGVQGQVFYPLSSMKGGNGELYFGGTNGFTVVQPHNFNRNTNKPRVLLTNIFVNNQSILHTGSEAIIRYKPDDDNIRLLLNHNQTNLGFEISSDSYLMPQKNRFKYRLKGYQDDWIEVDATSRSVFYSKLPSGDYVFEVYASNNDGVWGDEPMSLNIKRTPAPWMSWWAYTLYIMFFGCIVYVVLRAYMKSRKLELALFKENLEKQKQEEVHQSQLRFFTNISHDLKTPLSLITATIDTLRNKGLQEYYFNILNNNSMRLLNLINELMLFRKIESGKLPLKIKSENFNHFIKSISFDFKEFANKNNIDFQVMCDEELPEKLYFARHECERIIINLLNNAFKYSHSGGKVSVETHNHTQDFRSPYKNSYTIENGIINDSFCFVIRDNGKGVHQSELSNIFERFYKIDTGINSESMGTGIGLALVKNLVLLHKASLTVYSEEGVGTDIVVSFSRSNIYNEYSDIEENTKPTLDEMHSDEQDIGEVEPKVCNNLTTDNIFLREKKRILLVEDNEDLRRLIANFLSADYIVIEASNGVVASTILRDMEINLVVSDIMMPEKDGVTLCREIKNDMNFSHIPVLLLTAKSGVESKIEGTSSGADAYLEKPVNMELLLVTINNVFNRLQQLKDHYAKNYFADYSELTLNQEDNKFLKSFVDTIEANIDQPEMNVHVVAAELSMSRSKLYSKIKSITGKSIVEFVLSYRLRKAARMLIESDISIREVMDAVGIESQSYFTRVFKKEFGDTPSQFVSKNRVKNDLNKTNNEMDKHANA